MLENNYANEIEGLNLNEQTKKEEFKLKFKMVGKSDIITDWAFEMVIQLLEYDESTVCLRLTKMSGCSFAFHNKV